MLVIEVGVDGVIEKYRDPADPNLFKYRRIPGQHVTEFKIEIEESAEEGGLIRRDPTVEEAVKTVTHAIPFHSETPPKWIDCNVVEVREALVAHYNLVNNTRPRSWGHGGDDAS
jgi:hypothetical protein